MTTMNDSQFFDVDDQRVGEFERAWLAGSPGNIDDYLPARESELYLGTLEELVHIDLEFRWKDFDQHRDSYDSPPGIERYLQRYPELDDVKLGLIQGEFELAARFGNRPSVQQFVDRFGEQISGQPLRVVLDSVLALAQRNALPTIRPGVTLDRYEIVNEHGRGGFGAVWRATDTKLGRRIAVKQLGQRLATDAESRRRFISEARVTAKLEHPGIVPVYDISYDQDQHAWYTMRLIQGRTLAEAIDQLHQLDPKTPEFELERQRLIQSFLDACQTFEYAHSQGVIHRDIKPQNIIVGDYGETIVLDWGLASVIETPDPVGQLELTEDSEILSGAEAIETLRGAAIGTPAYMPPEQAYGDLSAISRRSDVYALGATLYHLVTGQVPFTDGPLDELLDRVKLGRIPLAHEANSHVTRPLSAIIAKAMQVKAEDRYVSVGDLIRDVQRYQADQPVSVWRDALLGRAARWVRKNNAKAASLALLFLFAITAGIAGILINNHLQTKEALRLGELEVNAERADAMALSQIRSGKFESASRTLEQAYNLIAGEPALADLADQLSRRRARNDRIVAFYALNRQAEERTFFDRIDEGAAYSQAALQQLNVFNHTDWWAHLPLDDLTPLQAEQLREHVYRSLGLLATVRAGQMAAGMVSLKFLTEPGSVDEQDNSRQYATAAGTAAAAANNYRVSRSLELIEQLGELASGDRPSLDLTGLTPRNPIDSAIMGSVLDSHVPAEGPERTAVSAILNFRDPSEVALAWLDSAVQSNPQWYWLPVFKGLSYFKTGQLHAQRGDAQAARGAMDAAIKSLSHAIGVEPEYWVAYQYRAWANLVAAQLEQVPRTQKRSYLSAANRDIQRALDLEQRESDLYLMRAFSLSATGAPRNQVYQAFLDAIALRRTLPELGEGHYSAMTGYFFQAAQQLLDQHQGLAATPEQYELQAALKFWQGEGPQALSVCREGLVKFPENANLRLLKVIVDARLTESGERDAMITLQIPESYRFAWRLHMLSAQALTQRQQLDEARQALDNALATARTPWQQGRTYRALALLAIASQNWTAADAMIDRILEHDLAADLSELIDAIEKQKLDAGAASEADPILTKCQRLSQRVAPITQRTSSTIEQPALFNGGFELGLSWHWTPSGEQQTSGSWMNLNASNSVAQITDRQSRSGTRCLEILLDADPDTSYGQMSQTVPVSPGEIYELSFWARSESLVNGELQVGAGDPDSATLAEAIKIAGGTSDWQPYRLKITATGEDLTIVIRGSGSGRAWLDDIRLQRIEDFPNK